ncbi:MAG: hydrogen peroxide-inducible genes activator [Sphingomonadaceae bacterium]|nr:hydrogen peroxide-inducible genes activator [Sphingomonadaceae bacterium]
MPTLRQLQYLATLADTQHFGRAAAAVHVSQPTLSQQLRQLEAKLGVTLVERGDTPVQLTPVGREIAQRARRVLVQVDDIVDLARRSTSGIAGTIRFGVTPTLGPYLMPAVVAQLHRAHPDMRLYMREGIPDDQLAELRRGGLDLLLVPLPVAGADLEVEPLFREPLHLVAPPDHALCSKTQLTTQDLAGQGVLSLDTRHHFHRQAQAICGEFGAELLRDYEGTSLDSLRQMAGSGLGLAILPELYLHSEVGGEDMVQRLEVSGWSATRSIAAVWREGAAYSDTYRLVAGAIAAEARRVMAQSL